MRSKLTREVPSSGLWKIGSRACSASLASASVIASKATCAWPMVNDRFPPEPAVSAFDPKLTLAGAEIRLPITRWEMP